MTDIRKPITEKDRLLAPLPKAKIQFEGLVDGIKKELKLVKFASSLLSKVGIDSSELVKVASEFENKFNSASSKITAELMKKYKMQYESKDMKLTTLLPLGRITTLRHGGSAKPLSELAFHGGNPTSEDIDVYEDDFNDAFEDAEKSLDDALDGILDMVHESELKDVESAVRQQITLFRKAVGAFRVSVHKIFDAKKKKLGGR